MYAREMVPRGGYSPFADDSDEDGAGGPGVGYSYWDASSSAGYFTRWNRVAERAKGKRQLTADDDGEESYPRRSHESHNDDDDVSWSDEFHHLLIALSSGRDTMGDEEEERLFEDLRRLELDFVYTAETWGRVIIEELFLPDDRKTIKPLKGRGTLGGYKYAVHGVFFKFAHEIEYLVSSSNAAKVSANELRACGAVTLYALESSDCSVSLPSIVTHMISHDDTTNRCAADMEQ